MIYMNGFSQLGMVVACCRCGGLSECINCLRGCCWASSFGRGLGLERQGLLQSCHRRYLFLYPLAFLQLLIFELALLYDRLLHAGNLRLQRQYLRLARLCVHLEIIVLLAGLGDVLLERLELGHLDLDLVFQLGHVRLRLVVLGLLRLGLLDDAADALFEFALELCLNLAHLRLVCAHLFLVMLLVLAIRFDLLLDLLPNVLVALHFLSTRVP